MSHYRSPYPSEYLETPRRTDSTAVIALICAIGSWVVLPLILAVAALLLARRADAAITSAPDELSGSGLVTGARVLAWLNLLLVAMILAFVAAFAAALALGR